MKGERKREGGKIGCEKRGKGAMLKGGQNRIFMKHVDYFGALIYPLFMMKAQKENMLKGEPTRIQGTDLVPFVTVSPSYSTYKGSLVR